MYKGMYQLMRYMPEGNAVGKLLAAIVAIFFCKLMVTVLAGVVVHQEVSLCGKL